MSTHDSFYDCEIENNDDNELDTIINNEAHLVYNYQRRQFVIRILILFFIIMISFVIYLYYGQIDAFFIKIQNNV